MKITKGNSFEADIHHEEVTYIKVKVCFVLLNYFIIFCFLHRL